MSGPRLRSATARTHLGPPFTTRPTQAALRSAPLDERTAPSARAHPLARPPLAPWLELFYDLVFVAAILVLSSAVSHAHHSLRVLCAVAVFSALWWIWLETTLFTDRFRVDDVVHRVLVLAQMFLVILVAMEAHEGVIRDSAYLSITYALLVGTVAVMYARRARTSDVPGAYARTQAMYLAAAVLILFVAAAVEPAREVLWVVAILVTFLPFHQSANRPSATPLDERHLVERLGALTIIVCGEAFVKVAIAVSQGSIEDVDVIALAFEFVLVFAIWTSYFDDIPGAGLRRRLVPVWLALHLLLHISIAGTAIGVSKLVTDDVFDHLPASEIMEIAAPLAGIYLALGLIGVCTRRVPVRPLLVLRLGTSAVTIAVGLLAWLIASVNLVEGVAALTVVAIVHAALSVHLESATEVSEVPEPL
jgi:low temperature requirement protein LtrA